MIRLFQFLLHGCFHEYEIVKENLLDYDYDFSSGTATQYTLRCKKCGSMKVFLAKP